MTNDQIRAAAVEYVATGKADYAQIFTDPDCKVHRSSDSPPIQLVQVWVGIPTKDLVVPDWSEE